MSLGNMVSIYPSSRDELHRVLGFFALIITFGILLSAASYVFLPPKVGGPFVMIYIGMGLTSFLCMMIGVRYFFVSKRSGVSVDVCEDGLRITQSGATEEVAYVDIAYLEEDEEWHEWCKPLTYSWWLKIATFEGSKRIFAHGSQEGFPQLYNEIQTRAAKSIVPSTVKRLLRGETINLGRMKLNSAQVIVGQTALDWGAILGVGIASDGCVEFETTDGLVNCQRTKNLIPNWALIPEIAEYLRNETQRTKR